MRILSIIIGVLGGLAGLAFSYLLFGLGMLGGASNSALAGVFIYIILALVVASVLCLAGGLMDPRKPMSLRLSIASAATWVVALLLIVALKLPEHSGPDAVGKMLAFAGVFILPALFPLANVALTWGRARDSA